MADQKRSGRAKGVPHHPLVEALASDPHQPPRRATRLFGYPGPAADPKSTRLWLDLDLTTFVDVPDDAILYSRTLDDDEGTILWVEPTATLTHSSPQPQEVQAEFLAGSIAEGNLAAAPAAAPEHLPASEFFWCHITRTCKPTEGPCPTCSPWGCREEMEAAPLGGPIEPIAPTNSGWACQSWNFRCPTDYGRCGRWFPTRLCGFRGSEAIESRTGGCPPEPWTGTPVINPVGPFRPQR